MQLISLKGINKSVDDGEEEFHLLKNINVTISSGEFVAIVGPSGSGKSTLLNIIGCLERATAGSYHVAGANISKLEDDDLAALRNYFFGFIFQRYNLLESLTVVENVELPARYAGAPTKQRKESALALLEHLGLKSKINYKPSVLSGGQQQRISIARALMNRGKVILADEPTGALDVENSKVIMEILKQRNKEGYTIVLVTHDESIAAYADRTITLSDGCIVSNEVHRPVTQTIAFETNYEAQDLAKRAAKVFGDALNMSIQTICTEKLRASLTMLGVIIGIAATLFVIALGEGAQKKVLSDLNAMGTASIEVHPGEGFGDIQSWRLNSLSLNDVQYLEQRPFIKAVSPVLISTGQIIYNNKVGQIVLKGVGSQYVSIKNFKLSEGRFLHPSDITDMASVVVIDQQIKNTLFPHSTSVIGRAVLLDDVSLRVVGVIEQNSLQQDNVGALTAYSPFSTVWTKLSPGSKIQSISIKLKDSVNATSAESIINSVLLKLHNGKKDFFTFNIDLLHNAVKQTSETMSLSAACIAFISLLVGGIGVMNIMLVSVAERVSEIGLRMAIGARRAEILIQFVIESIILCLLGSLLGVFTSYIVQLLFMNFAPDIPLAHSACNMFWAFFCSIIFGVFFGIIPAYRASRLTPATALLRD
ncbi:ABC transporter permease [Halodesulfovibrio sp.]|jgi:macrolide transport system ATP-binding/permease protein|uniref:ABC transporter permease n=1 Tax=Halodesulfovibrio sp. TaxID=1912772 RepID=UPI0025DB8961|nr:ABC transporter permease [Halodesulfovibrio sp.]MCT4625456.1 ABC transporter permease [Halodesulfovibrio sp.]